VDIKRSEELQRSVIGKKFTKYSYDNPDFNTLETFQNRYAKRDYIIHIKIPEFTCLCPVTGQPDFGTIYITYIPDQKCIESKALKLYVCAFRNYGIFYEDCVNKILEDCVKISSPRWMRVTGDFFPRGGISISPVAEYKLKGFKIPELTTKVSPEI